MILDSKRYYAVLGVDPVCTEDELRHAFRRRAKELHPDAETGSASAFIHLKRAYDTLIDPASRARYDRARPNRFRRSTLVRPTRPDRHRPGGMSLRRYVVAFLVMAGLSYGAIELMIDLSGETPPRPLRQVVPADVPHAPSKPTPDGAKPKGGFAPPSGPGAGFWDPNNPTSQPERPPAKGWRAD